VSLPVGEHGTLRHEALFKEAPGAGVVKKSRIVTK
jgi:hypothetical protein